MVLTRPFYLGVTEVTQAQYQGLTGTNPSKYRKGSTDAALLPGQDDLSLPVKTVSWKDADRYCSLLSETPSISTVEFVSIGGARRKLSLKYRLPTNAEWEFAARAGSVTKSWAGSRDEDLTAVDWVLDNAQGCTHPVGEKPANPFGLKRIG